MNEKLRVVNAVRNGIIAKEWEAPLLALLNTIGRGPHRLAGNYLPEQVDLTGHLSFDLLVNSAGEIVSFAGVYNGGRYPKGVYRILNRTWVAESLRVKHGAFPFLTSRLILPSQIESLGRELKLIFVSRETPRGKFFLKKWRAQQSDPQSWHISEKMVQVVPDIERASCFQFVCKKQLQPVEWNPVQITETQWSLLPQ